ncbi:MAG: hypothetical protein IJV14_16285 [Lachnospiraceae bacterium]|nr:hypothetical protein [Lachnospiraceae bacterium]MBQ9614122.1 hypothetical protein [Lachnospiraceae bacterium]
MSTGLIVSLVILAVLIGATVALYFVGKKMQKRQAEQQAQIEATKQPVKMLIIDKKRLPIKQSGLPQQVIDSTPWYAKRSKLPVVKAKVGPQIMNLIADEQIFDFIPVKKEVRAMVSGIYIVEVKGLHGQKLVNTNPKKKNWFTKTMDKIREKGGAGPVK